MSTHIITSKGNSSSTPLLSGESFVGIAEDFPYPQVMIVVKTNRDGAYSLQFSNDSINWDSVLQYSYNASGINPPHVLIKGDRYFRFVFDNTSGLDQTFFRLETYYGFFGNLTSKLNTNINDEADSLIVRSVQTGSNPLGDYVNTKTDGYIIYETTPLSGGGVYDSGILDLDSYSQIQTELYSDVSGTLNGFWYADPLGMVLMRTFTRPYNSLTLDYFSAPRFAKYLRYTYTNDGVAQTSFFLGFSLLTKSISGQLLGLEDFISPAMSANLGRNVIVGKTEAGLFLNAGITDDSELLTNTKASNRQTRALYSSSSTADTYALLVDLSAEPYNNLVGLDNIGITCNLSANNSNCNIKIGVITRIDGTDADISYLISLPFSVTNANNFISYINNFQPSSCKFEVSGGSLIDAYTNDTQTAVTSVNTGITLPSARDINITPDVGDIIIYFDHTGANFNSVISAIYHTE